MVVIHQFTSSEAAAYSAKYDSGPASFMAVWRASKRNKRFKPRGIPLDAWILLAGPFKGHRAVVADKKPNKKYHVVDYLPLSTEEGEMSHARTSNRPACLKSNVSHVTKTTVDISAECLQYLVENGYGKEQASALVDRCEDLLCTRYSNRDSKVRRLTFPGEPTKRCTSLSQWIKIMKEKHPPKTP
jgi:hypothetical protein